MTEWMVHTSPRQTFLEKIIKKIKGVTCKHKWIEGEKRTILGASMSMGGGIGPVYRDHKHCDLCGQYEVKNYMLPLTHKSWPRDKNGWPLDLNTNEQLPVAELDDFKY